MMRRNAEHDLTMKKSVNLRQDVCEIEFFYVFVDCRSREQLRVQQENIKDRRRDSVRTSPSCSVQR